MSNKVKHIVCWKFREDAGDKRENLKKAKEMLEGLKEKIPGIINAEVGINHNTTPEAFELALYSEFESQEALDQYQVHPEHKLVVDYMRKVRLHRVVVDYLG